MPGQRLLAMNPLVLLFGCPVLGRGLKEYLPCCCADSDSKSVAGEPLQVSFSFSPELLQAGGPHSRIFPNRPQKKFKSKEQLELQQYKATPREKWVDLDQPVHYEEEPRSPLNK